MGREDPVEFYIIFKNLFKNKNFLNKYILLGG